MQWFHGLVEFVVVLVELTWADGCQGSMSFAFSEKYFSNGLPGKLFNPATTQAALNCAPMSVVCVRWSEKKVATLSAPVFL
jgi:hypothetical protein